jgi:MFS family permease
MSTPPFERYPAAPQYPDRSGWLTAFGIFQIVIACVIVGFIGILLLSLLISSKVPNQPATPWRIMMQVVVGYAGACVFFVVMGIGSIQARRWARSLMLAVSWLWFLGGAVGTLMYAFMLPRMFKQTPGTQLPENVVLIMTVVMLIFMFAIFIVLPFVMLMFYRAPSVKATCERRDPMPRWTDCLPLPMLVLFVMLATGTVSFFLMAFTMPYVAFFGRFITGWIGTVACIVLSGWWAYLSWGAYRLRISAWWATLISMIVVSLSGSFTFLRGDAAKMYTEMGMPAAQSAMSAAMLRSPVFVGMMMSGIIAFIVFLMFLRKYYAPAPNTQML